MESHELYAQHIDIIHDGLQVNGPHTQHIHDFIDDHQQSLEDINNEKNVNLEDINKYVNKQTERTQNFLSELHSKRLKSIEILATGY